MRRVPKRPDLPGVEQRRQIRVAAGMTQSTLAFRIGVSPSSIAMWESGKYNPRGLTRDAYAKALNQLVKEQGES